AVVVTGAGQRSVGIVSEREIVRALAEHGTKALSLPLTDFMTRKVVTCTCAETISGLMERMTGGKFQLIPVAGDDRMDGIISIGDVVNMRVMEMEQEHNAMRDYIQTA